MQKRKPKLGQNFLSDPAARRRIADAMGDISDAVVIEIGPGHGAITDLLAPHARRLICVELDRELAPALRSRYSGNHNVEIVEADILQTDLSGLIPSGQKARIVGNLPYYITSDILLHLFAAAEQIEFAVVMMQREVADRVAAQPGSRDFGLLSATAQMYGRVSNLFTLPPGAFSPPPDVYSSVVRIDFCPRFAELGVTDIPAWTQFVRACFQQKRKTLSNNLRAFGLAAEQVGTICAAAGVPASARAEALDVVALSALFRSAEEVQQKQSAAD